MLDDWFLLLKCLFWNLWLVVILVVLFKLEDFFFGFFLCLILFFFDILFCFDWWGGSLGGGVELWLVFVCFWVCEFLILFIFVILVECKVCFIFFNDKLDCCLWILCFVFNVLFFLLVFDFFDIYIF